jgi:hypothetical protein
MKEENVITRISKASSNGGHPQRDIPFSIDVKGGEIETLMRSNDHKGSMRISMSKC